jgi:hypothetical protein
VEQRGSGLDSFDDNNGLVVDQFPIPILLSDVILRYRVIEQCVADITSWFLVVLSQYPECAESHLLRASIAHASIHRYRELSKPSS